MKFPTICFTNSYEIRSFLYFFPAAELALLWLSFCEEARCAHCKDGQPIAYADADINKLDTTRAAE